MESDTGIDTDALSIQRQRFTPKNPGVGDDKLT
jgi:hypothetical protein